MSANDNSGGVPGGIPAELRDVRGLLKFCIEKTASEDTTGPTMFTPMDEQRRKWLEEAMLDMTVSPQKRMMECIKVLVEEDDDGKPAALEELIEWCQELDLATDFHKIGGFQIIPTLLTYHSAEIREMTCALMATLTQNHPYCQQVCLDCPGLMDRLIEMIETDGNSDVKIKAMLALSSSIRSFPEGKEIFVNKKDGFSVLMRAMQADIEKLQIKAVFLLRALCDEETYKGTLCNMGMVEQLIGLLNEPHGNFHEHLLATILNLVTNNEQCRRECRRQQLEFKALLEERKKQLKGDDQFQDEYEYCVQIEKICFTDHCEVHTADR